MDIRQFSNLIEKYKKGECTPREIELLDNFLESLQNNSGEWIENEMGSQKIAEERIFSAIRKNINGGRNNYREKIFLSSGLLKIAASIVLFVVIGTGILYVTGILPYEKGSVTWHEKITLPGEKADLTLPDGSKVILNSSSKLRYTESLNDKNRDMYLEGEAYFEVHHNSNKPFIVHSGNITTTDLGTQFDISAYPENNTIKVSLLEGRVKISSKKEGENNKTVILKPKEQLLYNKGTDVSKLGVFDSLSAVGWKYNIYKFENEPLDKVLRRLGRAFGVKFQLKDQTVLAQKITAKFENNSLKTVVEVIKSLTGLNYKMFKKNNDIKTVLFFR